MLDAFKRVFGSDSPERRGELERDLVRVRGELERCRQALEDKRRDRLDSLFPQGPVPGAGPGRYPDLAPINFEEREGNSWLVALATRVIDGFPGSETLLSQLDATLRAYSEANHYRIRPGGPDEELLRWRDETLAAWDLQVDVPLYVGYGSGTSVVGCSHPFLLLDRMALGGLPEAERRFVLAAELGHVFFGNLRIFSFHRLMAVLDQLPSMSSLITRGLGMIPGIGNTISRGLELARQLNEQVVRKTRLLVGVRQGVLCDRLAVLTLGDAEAARSWLVRQVLGPGVEPARVAPDLIEQGRELQARMERGEVDIHMLAVVGPGAPSAAWRLFRLEQWLQGEAYQRLSAGYYVTRARLADYQRTHKALEDAIRALEGRLLELHEKQEKLLAELAGLGGEGEGGEGPGAAPSSG